MKRTLEAVLPASGLRVRDATQAPEQQIPGAAATLREVLATEGLSLRVLRVEHGRCALRPGGEELLFVLRGTGALHSADSVHALEPQTGALIPANESYALEGSLELVSVSVHEPLGAAARQSAVSRLSDQAAHGATAEREYRIVLDPACGCASATQFVGYIPPGRAPAHFHRYDEVIYVLEGAGVMHADGERTPVRVGSCIALPALTLHTLENSGPGTMRILGVFRPAGSPAAAFYPDGTPASQDTGSMERAAQALTDRGGST